MTQNQNQRFTEEFLHHAENSYYIPCRDESGTVDCFAKSYCGDTLLHVAVGIDSTTPPFTAIDTIRFLVSEGLDVNAQGEFMTTPLHLASQFGLTDVVTLLLDLGADPSITDILGRAPTLPGD